MVFGWCLDGVYVSLCEKKKEKQKQSKRAPFLTRKKEGKSLERTPHIFRSLFLALYLFEFFSFSSFSFLISFQSLSRS